MANIGGEHHLTDDFAGQRIALLTQHGKERVIAPVLEPALGCSVLRVEGFDTDQLGTFTREVPRPGSQLDAARRKARKGMELSGLPLGLASEGSFVPDPFTGMFPWNVELLVLIDDRLGLEIVATAQGPGRSAHLQASEWAAIEAFANREEFPAHQLVMRPCNEHDARVIKGIAEWDALREAFAHCAQLAGDGQVFVETDLRAFANPTRMARIAEAAQDLLSRIESRCPECATPGWAVVERKPGLPCAACRLPTRTYRFEVWHCLRCTHRVQQARTDVMAADPQHCAFCNP